MLLTKIDFYENWTVPQQCPVHSSHLSEKKNLLPLINPIFSEISHPKLEKKYFRKIKKKNAELHLTLILLNPPFVVPLFIFTQYCHINTAFQQATINNHIQALLTIFHLCQTNRISHTYCIQ